MSNDTRTPFPEQLDSTVRRFVATIQQERGMTRLIVLSVVVFTVFSLLRPNSFFTVVNFQTVGLGLPEIGLLSLAVMVSFTSGGIDLSVVSTAVFGALTAAFLFRAFDAAEMAGGPAVGVTILAVLLAIVVGGIAGSFNGFLIAVVGITPILATLGTMTLYNGLAIVITDGRVVYGMPRAFLQLGNGMLGVVPYSLLVFLVVGVLLATIINRTPLGVRIRLVGANAAAARYSGIDNRRVLFLTYITSGALAGTAGVLMAAKSASASADYGASYLLLAITIAILGGTNPNGGYGSVFGVMLATLTLQLVSSGFNHVGLSNFEYQIAQGVILIGVMVANVVGNRRRVRGRRRERAAGPSIATPAASP